MYKGMIRAVVLSLIFVGALFGFGAMANHTNEDLTTEMEGATLPVISMYQNGVQVNELHGYSTEMNAAYMRDAIMPVGEDRKLPITILTYQTAVDTISYEIRSLDAERLIANADVNSYEERRGRISAELTIQNLLEKGEEYLLIIRLGMGEDSVYYYTRIVEPVECHVEECVEFALDFHSKTFNSETTGALSTYMEKTTGDNSTLQFVSLNSSLKQVGWADFNGERLTEPVPSIKEITPTYSVIVLDYVVTRVGEAGESEYYNVEEYYRVRYTSSRIYLLNFERRMGQIFRGENESLYENGIVLGIRPEDVDYMANETGKNVAFVQEGELWSYDAAGNTLIKVFSFRGYEGIDNRENYGEHGIRIAGIDEAGNVDYIVYGYMNRGIHEGQVGIAVYHYNRMANTNEELVFIPSAQSYEVMKSELGQLMYMNENKELFLMVDRTVYGIDLDTLKTRELVKNLSGDCYAVSESNAVLAWADPQEEGSSIHVLDLTSQKTTDITEREGEILRPLGFMDEDLVYGIARETDIFRDAAGNVSYPMYKIRIAGIHDGRLSALKDYEKNGYFISDVEISGYTMYLNRISYNGTAYVPADQDMIMNREGDGQKAVSIITQTVPEKQRQVQIALPEAVPAGTPRLLTPRETILEENRTVAIENEKTGNHYYVYVKGDVILATDDVTEAVITANGSMGVVIGDHLEYIWKRARKAVQPAFSDITAAETQTGESSIVQCLNAMLEKEDIHINVGALIDEGETPWGVLTNTMRDVRVLDLTGCTVDEVLYYVSCGSPVFAMTGSGDAVLLTGYDSSNVIVFDPNAGASRRIPVDDADELFADAGNIFFTYLGK
ncbi:MAG: hypothetical protein HFI35_01485 [Roseburia sp.]|nr:hypothetical protein [Roseburia sp.]